MTISGVTLADKIAENRLTEADKKALAAQREESLKKQNLWKQEQQAKKEFGRGFQIELEKEKRVKAGLPEYDIQNSTSKTNVKSGKKKAVSAEEILKQQKGSEALGELRKKSHAQALVAKAEHQGKTGTASEKHIHKEIKQARKLDPASVKGINEKEIIQNKEVVKDVVKENGNDIIKSTKETTKKSGGLFSKIGKFFKGKGGKLAIGAAAVGLLAAGGAWLYNKLTGKKEETVVDKDKDTTTTTKAKDENKTPEKTTTPDDPKAVTPVPSEDKKDKTNPTDKKDPTKPVAPENPDKKDNTVPKDYIVKKGDCVWNIAKQHLKDLSNDPNYKPTDAEILKHTKELMELNQLEFEPDGYHVMIRPNDKLKLVA